MKTVTTASELRDALANRTVTKVILGANITADATITRKVDLDLDGKTLTGNASFTTTATGTVTLGAGTVTGTLTVNTPKASFVNNATVNGITTITDVADHTFTNNGTLHGVTIKDTNGTRFVNSESATVGTVTVDAVNATVRLEGIIPSVVVSKAATLTVIGKVTSLTANAAVALEGTGTVVGTTGTGVVKTGAGVTVETGAYDNVKPTISNTELSGNISQLVVGFQVDEAIDLSESSKGNVVISYRVKDANGTYVEMKEKNKFWSGYLNIGTTKYAPGVKSVTSDYNEAYSAIIPADQKLLTAVNNPKWITQEQITKGDLKVVLTVTDNAGNHTEKELTL